MRIKRIAGQLLAAWIVLLCLLPGHASGDDRPTFLVAVQGAYARLAPGVAAPVAFAAPQGQSYTVTGRSADNAWINVGNGWLPALLGDLSGDLNTVPVTPLPAGFAANSNRAALPSWVAMACASALR